MSKLCIISPISDYRVYHYRSESEFIELCQSELSLCENCLRVNPKAYCVWLARQWILLQSPQTDWVREKELCDKFLVYDERNCES